MSENFMVVIILCLLIATCGSPDLIDTIQCRLYEPHCK